MTTDSGHWSTNDYDFWDQRQICFRMMCDINVSGNFQFLTTFWPRTVATGRPIIMIFIISVEFAFEWYAIRRYNTNFNFRPRTDHGQWPLVEKLASTSKSTGQGLSFEPFSISIGQVSREFCAVQEIATKKVLLREKSTKKYPNSTQTSPVVMFFDALSDNRIKKGVKKSGSL